jgi:hypothetical protein
MPFGWYLQGKIGDVLDESRSGVRTVQCHAPFQLGTSRIVKMWFTQGTVHVAIGFTDLGFLFYQQILPWK